MLRVEFHCHTCFSEDSLTTPAALIEAARKKGLDRVIITDHNSVAGARAAQAIDPVRVIVGEEIMTTAGELLAVFVQEEVPPGLAPAETIGLLREQGAFISVSHPFDGMRKGHWTQAELSEIVHLVDAIEVFNARCIQPRANQEAQYFAQEHNLLGTVGSDAHASFELGRATLSLARFDHTESLKEALRQATAKVHMSPAWVHFLSRYAKWRKLLGWRADCGV